MASSHHQQVDGRNDRERVLPDAEKAWSNQHLETQRKAEKEKLLRTRYAFSSTQSVMCTLAHPGLPLMQRRSPGKRHGTCGP